MELLDVYDINRNKLNKTIVRNETWLDEGEFVLITTIWIRSGIRFLVQHTSKQKGSENAVTGGCVTAGNDSRQQIKIECKEELGFDLKDENLSLLGSLILEDKRALLDVYIYEDEQIDLEEVQFQLQESEVESVAWLSKNEIEDLILKDQFRSSSATQYMKLIRNL